LWLQVCGTIPSGNPTFFCQLNKYIHNDKWCSIVNILRNELKPVAKRIREGFVYAKVRTLISWTNAGCIDYFCSTTFHQFITFSSSFVLFIILLCFCRPVSCRIIMFAVKKISFCFCLCLLLLLMLFFFEIFSTLVFYLQFYHIAKITVLKMVIV
jgi:hypothetical protein